MDNIIGIKYALERLRFESIRCPHSDDGVKMLMKKYGMLFLGENLNYIYSHEFCHALKNKFGLEIDFNELNEMIPAICKSLHMNYIPIINNDSFNSIPFEYQIILF